MNDEASENQRQALLANLFGPDVPAGLGGQLLRTTDVATLFQVSERTVSEWARRGRIPSVRTPGGHRRYAAEDIRQLLDEAEEHPRSATRVPEHPPGATRVAGRPAGD